MGSDHCHWLLIQSSGLLFTLQWRRRCCRLQLRSSRLGHPSDFRRYRHTLRYSRFHCHHCGLCSHFLFHNNSFPLFSESYVCHYSCCPRYPRISSHRRGRSQQILVIQDSSQLCPLLMSQLKATK